MLPDPKLVWGLLICSVSLQLMCRYPHGGFPLISHHTQAVIPTLWRKGICHLAACFPLLSQERSWVLIYCEVSPGSLNLQASRITEWRKLLTVRMAFSWKIITQASTGDWLRSCLFPSHHPLPLFQDLLKCTGNFLLWISSSLADWLIGGSRWQKKEEEGRKEKKRWTLTWCCSNGIPSKSQAA